MGLRGKKTDYGRNKRTFIFQPGITTSVRPVTGKTVALKVLAESFSDCGVPVFLADIKGDLAGMCCPGTSSESLQKRIDAMGLMQAGYQFKSYPSVYWDVYGEKGMLLRAVCQ